MHTRRGLASAAAIGCLLLLAGCGSSDPFAYVQVSGKVIYDDGSRIPVDQLVLTFIPQGAPLDAKTYPRPGVAMVTVNDCPPFSSGRKGSMTIFSLSCNTRCVMRRSKLRM